MQKVFYFLSSRCFHGLGQRIQVRLYRKMMFFKHNFASAFCSIEHKRIYLIESKAYQATWEVGHTQYVTSRAARIRFQPDKVHPFSTG